MLPKSQVYESQTFPEQLPPARRPIGALAVGEKSLKCHGAAAESVGAVELRVCVVLCTYVYIPICTNIYIYTYLSIYLFVYVYFLFGRSYFSQRGKWACK